MSGTNVKQVSLNSDYLHEAVRTRVSLKRLS